MIARSPTKLLFALAAMLALSAYAFGGATAPRTASAIVSAISVDRDVILTGGEAELTVTAEDFDGNLVVTTTNGILQIESCELTDGNIDCDNDAYFSGDGTDTVTVDTDALDADIGDGDPDELVLVLDLLDTDCEGDIETITLEADQDGTNQETDLTCIGETNISFEKLVDSGDDDEEFEFFFDIGSGGQCLDDDYDPIGDFFVELEDGESISLVCMPGGFYSIEEDVPSGWTLDEIDCVVGSVTAGDVDDVVDINDDDVEIDFEDPSDTDDYGISVDCFFINDEDAAPAPGVIDDLQVSAAPSTIGACGGSTFIYVTVWLSSGSTAPGGTIVTVNSSAGGSFSPAATAATAGSSGLATFLYTAPANFNGVTTITAQAGNDVDTLNLQVLCSTTAPSPQPTQPPAPPPVVVSPPNAGDAGLTATGSGHTGAPLEAGPHGATWYLAVLSILAATVAAVAIMTRRPS